MVSVCHPPPPHPGTGHVFQNIIFLNVHTSKSLIFTFFITFIFHSVHACIILLVMFKFSLHCFFPFHYTFHIPQASHTCHLPSEKKEQLYGALPKYFFRVCSTRNCAKLVNTCSHTLGPSLFSFLVSTKTSSNGFY
jgi:hypothetical protein